MHLSNFRFFFWRVGGGWVGLYDYICIPGSLISLLFVRTSICSTNSIFQFFSLSFVLDGGSFSQQ